MSCFPRTLTILSLQMQFEVRHNIYGFISLTEILITINIHDILVHVRELFVSLGIQLLICQHSSVTCMMQMCFVSTAFNPLRIRIGGSLQDQVVYNFGNHGLPCHPFRKTRGALFGFSKGCLLRSRWNELNSFFLKTGY